MAVPFTHNAAPGKTTLYLLLLRRSDSFLWNHVASAWQAAPSLANRKVPLVEGTAENVGKYTVAVTGLGDADIVEVTVHDSSLADRCVGVGQVAVWGGNEVDLSAAERTTSAIRAKSIGMDVVKAAGTPDNYSEYTEIMMHLRSGAIAAGVLPVKNPDGTAWKNVSITVSAGADPVTGTGGVS